MIPSKKVFLMAAAGVSEQLLAMQEERSNRSAAPNPASNENQLPLQPSSHGYTTIVWKVKQFFACEMPLPWGELFVRLVRVIASRHYSQKSSADTTLRNQQQSAESRREGQQLMHETSQSA